MGNFNSQPLKKELLPKKIELSSNTKEVKINKIDEDQIFKKILDISNEMISEYNTLFLKNDFCNHISFIFEKKLSNLDIKLLKEIYTDINSDKNNEELTLFLQYIPKNEEKFIDYNNFFKDTLLDNLGNKNIKINSELIKNIDKDLKEDIFKNLKDTPKYIDQKHVNKLLNSIKNNNNNSNKLIEKVGGFIKNNLYNNNNDNNENIENSENSNYSKNSESNEILKNNSKPISEKKDFVPLSKYTKSYETSIPEKTSYTNIPKENKIKDISKIMNTYIPKYEKSSNINLVKDSKAKNSNNNLTTKIVPTLYQPKIEKTQNSVDKSIDNNNPKKIEKTQNSVDKSIDNNNQKKIEKSQNSVDKSIENNYPKKIEKTQNSVDKSIDNNPKKIENKINQIISKNITGNVEKDNIPSKEINKLIKYSIPENFKITSYCKNKYKCELTKKELCQAISENLIIKNNIIAAILTTIPYKNSNGEYIGGLCYKKFLNLDNCKVCLPDNYKSFLNKNIREIIPYVIQKANFTDKKSCKENDGTYFELTYEQKQILARKIKNISTKELKENPKLKYNVLYADFTSKLKNTYFENLNYLIEILEILKSKLIFSNKYLNELSNKTQNIINDIYNMCNYYYIFAIIFLIKLDVKDEDNKTNPDDNFIFDVLQKQVTKRVQ